jgi:hypothetical protein
MVQHAPVSDDIGRVAGHEQDLESRQASMQVFGKIPAVHFRYDRVGDQQISATAALVGQTHSLARLARFQHLGVDGLLAGKSQ